MEISKNVLRSVYDVSKVIWRQKTISRPDFGSKWSSQKTYLEVSTTPLKWCKYKKAICRAVFGAEMKSLESILRHMYNASKVIKKQNLFGYKGN